jgi:20S proteasome subunit alpha 6
VVGVDEAFHILDQETVQQLINAFEIVGETEAGAAEEEAGAEEEGTAAEEGAAAHQDAAPMDI